MSGVTLISDIAWVKRGVAAAVPTKVKIDAQELRSLVQGGDAVTEESDQTETDNAMEEDNPERQTKKLRGSGVDVSAQSAEGDDSTATDEKRPINMANIAVFASPLDDPYITEHVESDNEDREDFEIKPEDNLVAVAKIDKDEYTLEVYVFNESSDDWYVHHDYMLDAPPLCLEHVCYDPGDDNKKGNLLAVGTMNSVVNIWDLDVVNGAEPVVSLGKAKGKRHKRDGSCQCHTDAVLSLSWNRNSEHVLASGGADQTVVLWDLDDAKAATMFSDYDGKVQSLEWHPGESSLLLTGTLSGSVALRDCRQSESGPSKQWKVVGEVERVLWDHFNPFYFIVATDQGKLYYFDSRAEEPLHSVLANEGGTHGVSQSFAVKGLISSCGADSMLKVWKLNETGFKFVHSQPLKMGELHSLRFSPDSGPVVAVGGSKEDLIRIVPLDKFDQVKSAFSS